MFKSKVNLKFHRKKIHQIKKEAIRKCSICNSEFKNPGSLRIHTKRVHRPTTYPCDFCDMALTSKWSKINHEKTAHFGVKRFKCEVCDKGFSKAMDCKEHMWKQHEQGSPSHICHFCAKAF